MFIDMFICYSYVIVIASSFLLVVVFLFSFEYISFSPSFLSVFSFVISISIVNFHLDYLF